MTRAAGAQVAVPRSHGCDDGADHLDLRLAAGAGAAWLAVAVCLGRPPAFALTTAAIAGLIAVVSLIVGSLGAVSLGAVSLGAVSVAVADRVRRAGPALALVGFCVVVLCVPLAGRLAHARDAPLARLAAQRAPVTAVLTVTADPRTVAAHGVAGAPRAAIEAAAHSVVVSGRTVPVNGAVVVLGPAAQWGQVGPGQRVVVDGALQPPLGQASMSVALVARSGPTLVGRPPWWQRLATTVRTSLRRAAAPLPAQERGLLPGLVDGDTSGLDPVLREHFRLAGLTHLVAVSGTNCSILIGVVLLGLRRMRVRPAWCALAGGLVLVGFVLVARPSPSVLRAAAMAAIALVALAAGRPRQALPALSAAVLVLLAWDPLLAADYGFALSVLATAALLVLAPPWAEVLRRRRVPPFVAEAVAVAAAAHVVTAPIIAAIAGKVSLVAVPANVLAEPAVAPATVLGFAAAALSPVWMGGASLLAQLAGWPCRWLVGVADFFGGLHGATLPWPGGMTGGLALLAVSLAVMLLALRTGPRRVLTVAALAAVAVQIPVRSLSDSWPPPDWLFVACDVGQGDALALRAGPGSAVVVDAGPDPVAVDRCLRDLGIHDVALLVFTHDHLDHVAGLPGVLRGRKVEAVAGGPLGEPVSGAHLVQAALAARGLAVATPAPGQGVDVGDAHLDVLGPRAAYHGTRSDPNNSSLVLRATVDGRTILLPGDAEVEAQQALLGSGVDLRADVLKVPHHGSAYSDDAFLAAVHARVAVISVGLHNDYGHPSPLLLGELDRLGVPIRRTDRDGDVAVVGGSGQLRTVVHTVRASSVGLPPAPARIDRLPRDGPVQPGAAVSAGNARISAWPLAPSASTISPTSCPRCCCSSVTRSSWSGARSARSPPPHAAATLAASSPS